MGGESLSLAAATSNVFINADTLGGTSVTNSNTMPDALRLFQQSSNDVLTLKSKLDPPDVRRIIHEVLTRVQSQNRQNTKSPDHPSTKKINDLSYALISEDPQEGARFIQDVYDDGASLEAIYLAYLAEAAATLGVWWENDEASFYEVSIGTSRIYGIMRGLSYLFVPDKHVNAKSAVFASVPGETHTLGIQMAADLFGKEGWDIDLIIGKDHDGLIAEIGKSGASIIGLSAAGRHSAAALAKAVIALRISNPSASICVSGRITEDSDDILALMGLDGIARDAPSALDLMEKLWHRALAR